MFKNNKIKQNKTKPGYLFIFIWFNVYFYFDYGSLSPNKTYAEWSHRKYTTLLSSDNELFTCSLQVVGRVNVLTMLAPQIKEIWLLMQRKLCCCYSRTHTLLPLILVNNSAIITLLNSEQRNTSRTECHEVCYMIINTAVN